ncbi:VOC family protein [Mycolicibacterium tusciae]|jgi:catechol 2,3-dioxygenase-like lactoylglutathione lyase family enzyme|uniref:Glyoxalase n=1 Tax=Mycolicibacterium tusciae TaxID=75922 RepID=A0A1X0JLY3_9MYCO|nr:VOC family protein [Mycolicibacterium tusciae]ORB63585.1 glyoxalase [Mycolicibacterium tusciae]
MNKISVRYIVDDVDAAVDFYTSVFQFEVAMRPAPGFAMLNRGELRLLLNSPGAGGAGQTLADGSRPEPGGWNRFQLQVDDLDEAVAEMRKVGADLRIDVIDGRGGRQALVPDPAGNLVEVFQPYA